MAKRLQAMGMERYRRGFEVTLHEDLLEIPLRWSKARVIFVNSMSDLFHEKVPLAFVRQVFSTMERCPQHVFQVLTKRSDRLKELAPKLPWPKNVWMGVSIEDRNALYRLDHLRQIPASIRFLSCEPLLGSIDDLPLQDIHWVIVGGESGPKARPIMPQWVDSILRQCKQTGVAFFFKQWGGTRKNLNGRTLNGRIYEELPGGSH